MKSVLKVLPLILFTAIPASAQEPELRREAVQLLERANGVSLSPKLPNLERVDTFRVFDSSSGPQEGTFTRVVVQGTGRREESRFGEYHSLDIWAGGHLATVRSSELPPAEINTVMRLTPIYLLRFADDDVIHAIVDKAAVGKKIRCIEFDTIRGQKIENNELCVDHSNGTLVLEKVGDELIENSECGRACACQDYLLVCRRSQAGDFAGHDGAHGRERKRARRATGGSDPQFLQNPSPCDRNVHAAAQGGEGRQKY